MIEKAQQGEETYREQHHGALARSDIVKAIAVAQHYISMDCPDFMVDVDGITVCGGVFAEDIKKTEQKRRTKNGP